MMIEIQGDRLLKGNYLGYMIGLIMLVFVLGTFEYYGIYLINLIAIPLLFTRRVVSIGAKEISKGINVLGISYYVQKARTLREYKFVIEGFTETQDYTFAMLGKFMSRSSLKRTNQLLLIERSNSKRIKIKTGSKKELIELLDSVKTKLGYVNNPLNQSPYH